MLKKLAYFVVAGFVYSHFVEPIAVGFAEGVRSEWPHTKARIKKAFNSK